MIQRSSRAFSVRSTLDSSLSMNHVRAAASAVLEGVASVVAGRGGADESGGGASNATTPSRTAMACCVCVGVCVCALAAGAAGGSGTAAHGAVEGDQSARPTGGGG